MSIIKKILRYLIGITESFFLFIFSYVIPKNNKLLLFGSMSGRSISGNPKIYYLYLKNQYPDKYDMYFYDPYKRNNHTSIKTYRRGLKMYWLLLRSKYLFIDATGFDLGIYGIFSGRFNLIQMWHGEPIKKIGFLSKSYIERRNKIILFLEKIEYKTYRIILSNFGSINFLNGCFLSKNTQGIGVPRNDVILNKNIKELVINKTIEKKIREWRKTFQKVILLAPTFRETKYDRYFSKNECNKLNLCLKENNILLIIKSHPNESRGFLEEEMYSNIKNITQEYNFDSTDFLSFIDGVITDYSSIYIDFLLTGKPVIWYQNDLDDYINKERGLLYQPDEVVISDTTAYNFNDFLYIIKQINTLSESKEYKEKYTKLKEKFYGKDIGKISSCEKLTNILFPHIETGKK